MCNARAPDSGYFVQEFLPARITSVPGVHLLFEVRLSKPCLTFRTACVNPAAAANYATTTYGSRSENIR
jgi:hypothetical protein